MPCMHRYIPCRGLLDDNIVAIGSSCIAGSEFVHKFIYIYEVKHISLHVILNVMTQRWLAYIDRIACNWSNNKAPLLKDSLKDSSSSTGCNLSWQAYGMTALLEAYCSFVLRMLKLRQCHIGHLTHCLTLQVCYLKYIASKPNSGLLGPA